MQSLYDSPLHNPILFLITGTVFLLVLARRMPFLQGYLVVFGVEILADALLTGGFSPFRGPSPLRQGVEIAFVLLGDFRFFLIVERALREKLDTRVWVGSALLTLVVPVLSQLASRAIPALGASSRVIFLSYELGMVALVAGLAFVVLRRRIATAPPASRRFLVRLFTFELVQYVGWALADAIILAGAEVGYLVRLVPNILYYAAFLPFVYLVAPTGERAHGERDPRASGGP